MSNPNRGTAAGAPPRWLLENKEYEEAGKIRTGFIRRTLVGVSKVLQNDLLAERFAGKAGLLQAVDPRVKLVTLLIFIVTAGVVGSIPALVVLCGLGIVLAKLSRLGTATFLRRVWLTLPLLVLILSIPAATNLLIPGKPLWILHEGLYLTTSGVTAVLKMALRIGVSFSFGYLLVMTTRWSRLTASLTALKIPGLVVAILDMTYRYIFVLVRLTVELFEARYLRTAGRVKGRENRRFTAGGMAWLFVRSSYMSEEIYHSMMCRGYAGEPPVVKHPALTSRDVVWIGNCLLIQLVVIIVG